MDRVILGRTGLSVSVAGLGCGGHSRLGQSQGASSAQSIALVKSALDLGITYFDTAQGYRTEEILGAGIASRRDEVVVSTKTMPRGASGALLDARGLRRAVEESLARLGTDVIDVFHLHGPRASDYAYCRAELVPELLALRDRGAIGHLGLSEPFTDDAAHEMLALALKDDCWDVLMVGFNILNPSARELVFPTTISRDLGVEVMYAVRNAFSNPEVLRRQIAGAVEKGLLAGGDFDLSDPLGFLVHDGGASSIVEAAYRFTRHEPGCHVVLTGTGSLEHLRENVDAINAPPLPDADLARVRELFGHLAVFTAN